MLPIDHFLRAARRRPDRPATAGGTRPMAYGELARRVEALAAAFQSIDPAPQSRVGICAYNTPAHLEAWLATLASGKTWIPLNPRNGDDELNRIVAKTRPSIIVADGDCLGRVNPIGATMVLGQPGSTPSDEIETLDNLADRFDGQSPQRPALTPDDVQAIKFTGGSSGTPKGCVQTYRVWNTCVASMIAEFRFDGDDANLLAAPMTHGTNTLILPTFAVGGRQVFMDAPAKPPHILDAIERHGVTSSFLTPTVLYMMMAEPDLAVRDLSSLRHLIAGGAAMRPEQVRAAMPLFNYALETCYGQTEAPQIAICMRAEDWRDERNLASTGRATILTEVGIMNPDGNLLPPNQDGEIVLKGDLVFAGYFEMPEQTKETIIDGWLHTGDIGAMDDRGFIFIKDRIRDVIVSGGFNIYPSDVEAVIGRHPAVRECIVFGLPDDKWGEAVHAAVEVHDGVSADGEAIIAFVKDHLDSVKAPKHIHFTDSLPRSPVGKVLRREAKVIFGAVT